MKKKRLGEILLEGKAISHKQLAEALKIKKKAKKRLGNILVEMGAASEEAICQTLSKQLNIPFVKLRNKKINQKVLNLLSPELCYKKRIIPLLLEGNSLVIAMSDPTNYEAMDDVSFATGYRVKITIALEQDILETIIRLHPPAADALEEIDDSEYFPDVMQIVQDTEGLEDISIDKLKKSATGAPIKRLTNSIIASAIHNRASDIHIEPQEKDVIVRYRIDGMMHDVMNFGKQTQAPVISRIKIMANLDITIRKKPQDGRARVRAADRICDLRVSSLPTFYGEKIVIRVLEPQVTLPLSELGIPERELNLLKNMLSMPQGLILVTGPTGSGKTTTLYAALNHIYSSEINIVTIEDPVEYSIPGINQVQVNPATGLTFAKGLRSLLRQDPNVIMIGEVRDKETAAIAFQAAQTGHLVLSTLHTNDAVSAVIRLRDIGVEPYVISSTLLGVLAQRLTRKIHEDCREVIHVDHGTLARIPNNPSDKFMTGKGCKRCNNSGYKGRIGIYELIEISQEISELITKNGSNVAILDVARKAGMNSMTEDGIEKAKKGITTLDEVMRTAPPSEMSPVFLEPVASADREALKSARLETPVENGFIKAQKPLAVPEKQEPLQAKPSRSGIRRDRIMIVDDDETVRQYVGKILEDEFYEVIQTTDGKDALNKIFEYPPDLILVDYMMPIMNGLEFISKIKSHSQLTLIPTIMLTATDTDESEAQALTAGADDWIHKPIRKPVLLARIKRLLKAGTSSP